MRVRYLLLAATLFGAAAGFLTSHWAYRDPVSPIATSSEVPAVDSLFHRFGRRHQIFADRVGKNHERVKEPFRELVSVARDSTVRIRNANQQVGLGVVVDPAGYVLTKHSELQGSLWCVVPGGRRYSAEIKHVTDDLDLAILKVNAPGLTAIQWTDVPAAVGSWVATTDGSDDLPLVIGVVGSSVRPIPEERAILGVLLEESSDGPRIERVLEHSMAQQIGLKRGDVIQTLNRQEMRQSRDLIDLVAALRPGDRVDLHVLRDGDTKTIHARLGRISELIFGDQEFERELDRGLSLRRGGFALAFQHDGVLQAHQCGGPAVNVQGQVIGLNIARSGRVATLALPSRLIQERLPEMLRQARSSSNR